jgi:DNA-binding NarL/FixJ family response regulator
VPIGDDEWSNSEFIDGHNDLINRHNDLISRYNKVVDRFNRNIARVNPVGRPIAASVAQQEQIVRHHKRGMSSRRIAEEMNLSRRTVRPSSASSTAATARATCAASG